MKFVVVAALAASVIFLMSWPALAYVGPGAGITLLGALWTVGAAVASMMFGLFLWPLRVLWLRLKKSGTEIKAAEILEASPDDQ